MMSPDGIVAMVMQMKPPLEIRNTPTAMQWRIKQAVYLTMQNMMDEMMEPIRKTTGGYWR